MNEMEVEFEVCDGEPETFKLPDELIELCEMVYKCGQANVDCHVNDYYISGN